MVETNQHSAGVDESKRVSSYPEMIVRNLIVCPMNGLRNHTWNTPFWERITWGKMWSDVCKLTNGQ
jgi:hypothetical protein